MRYDVHVKEGIKNVKKRLNEDGMEYIKKLSDVNYLTNNPFYLVDYRLELDTPM